MGVTLDPKTRAHLRFPEEVINHFDSLTELGFHRGYTDPTFVVYSSDRLMLRIFHGHTSCEIGLEFQELGELGKVYDMSSVLQLIEGDDFYYRNYATNSAEGVVEGVRLLRDTFQRCIDFNTLDDPLLFDKLKEQRARNGRKWLLDMARSQADEAWVRKDFSQIVDSLSEYRTELSPGELKMLEYSEKKVSGR